MTSKFPFLMIGDVFDCDVGQAHDSPCACLVYKVIPATDQDIYHCWSIIVRLIYNVRMSLFSMNEPVIPYNT